jgi:sugar-specific transcriptional regulator TrmB
MNKQNINSVLENYGLNEKESQVYLALLCIGDATAKEISDYSNIKRTTIYPIAEKLAKRGILGQYKARYGTHFAAINPRKLIGRLESIKSELTNILPELEAMEKKDISRPKVKYFEGKTGYLEIINESLNGYSFEVLYLGSAQELNEIITEKYVTDVYIPERLKRKIKFRQLVFNDNFSNKLKKNDPTELRVTKFLPNEYPFNSNMLIYGNKVAYFSSKNELATMLIESQDIAQMERQKFEIFWRKLS